MPAIELDDIMDIMDEIVDTEESGWEAFIQLREKLAEKAAQLLSHAGDGATAERTMGVSCPHCNRGIDIALLFTPRQ